MDLPELEKSSSPLNRLTMTALVHHEQQGMPASSVEMRMVQLLGTNEEKYQRRRVATKAWEHIDVGWLGESVSFIVVENLEGRDWNLRELADRLAASRGASLLLSFEEDMDRSLIILPGTFQLLYPTSVDNLSIRSVEQDVAYRVTAFPS